MGLSGLTERIKECPRFETCSRIKSLYDRELTDEQLRYAILETCDKCLQELTDKIIKSGCYRGCKKFREAHSAEDYKPTGYLAVCRRCMEEKGVPATDTGKNHNEQSM